MHPTAIVRSMSGYDFTTFIRGVTIADQERYFKTKQGIDFSCRSLPLRDG
jgi:hypothetical protein